MSILSTSPVNTRHFDMEIAAALGDINAAVIVQQLNYWMNKEGVGVIIEGVKYVYNSFPNWVESQFRWLSVWQFRKAMNLLRSLSIVKVIRYKAKQWNQTNYYSLDYDRLAEYLKSQKAEAGLALAPALKDISKCIPLGTPSDNGDASFPAESIETVEMWSTTDRDVRNPQVELWDSELSYKETEKTVKKETAKQSAAASLKKPLEEEKKPKQGNHHGEGLTACNGQKKINMAIGQAEETSASLAIKSEDEEQNTGEEKKLGQVDYIVNKRWKDQVKELDSTGIPINKTLVNLLKMYESEQVSNAIALFKVRKREQQIENPSGYFVQALKGNWAGKKMAVANSSTEENTLDTQGIFRHWYDLARELGYCSGQEVREDEQWVCLSGSWEKWSDAVQRGYSLDYLKKIMKRNQRR